MIGKPEERKKIKEFNEWKRIRLLSLQKKSSSSSTSTRSIVFRFKSSTTTTKMNPNENKKKTFVTLLINLVSVFFLFSHEFFFLFPKSLIQWLNSLFVLVYVCVLSLQLVIVFCYSSDFFFPFGNQIIQMKKKNKWQITWIFFLFYFV